MTALSATRARTVVYSGQYELVEGNLTTEKRTDIHDIQQRFDADAQVDVVLRVWIEVDGVDLGNLRSCGLFVPRAERR